MTKRKSDYVPAPTGAEMEEEMRQRYAAVLSVVSGQMTVTEAAKAVGLSRNRFQTLMHRGLTAMVNELVPKLPGPKPESEVERALREENEELKRYAAKLERRVETVDRMLGIASEMVRGKVKLTGRSREKRDKSEATPPATDGEEEADVEKVNELRALGMRADWAAAFAGRSASTLRRWTKRKEGGLSIKSRPGPAPRSPSTAGRAHVETLVRATRGLIGADALRHAVPGTTRRGCDFIKKETVRDLELERQAALDRVTVAQPNVVRGFDQLVVGTTDGRRFLLFSADGAVSYRTSVAVTDRYDAAAVARAVEADFSANGPPLVWRVDRAKQHDHADVLRVLDWHGVLLLHGPPRHPQYYAQLERQNREHRAWLEQHGPVAPDELPALAEELRAALNGLWPRRTLGWHTASEIWNARQPVDVDRRELREEVRERTARLRRDESLRDDQAERFAIEAALTRRGLIQRTVGGWR